MNPSGINCSKHGGRPRSFPPIRGNVLARGNTAASVSTTIGASFVTLVAVAAILAWPTVSRCSADPSGFGTCLKGVLAERGLLAPDGDTIDHPAGPDVLTDPPLPIAPAKPAGWLEATAAEISPARIAPVELIGAPAGEVNGQGPAADLPLSPVLLAPAAKVEATVAALSDAPATVARLNGDLGRLAASASAPDDERAAKVALIGPVGGITATAVSPPAVADGAAKLAPVKMTGTLTVTAPVEASGADPVPVAPLPVKPKLPLPVEATPKAVELTADITPTPIAVPVKRPVTPIEVAPTIKFNPAYPNVVVLPPPATGANSSIQSWTID